MLDGLVDHGDAARPQLLLPPTSDGAQRHSPGNAPGSGAALTTESAMVDDTRHVSTSTSPSWPLLTPINTDGTCRYFYLFVNPSSGGNAAGAFTESGLSRMHMRFYDDAIVAVLHIYDIRCGSHGQKEGFLHLKQRLASLGADSAHVCAIACGGDGTVMWMVSEMWTTGVDMTRVAVGTIPYGTGNDFARAFGWQDYNQTNPFNERMKNLHDVISKWIRSRIVLHDMWHATLRVHEDGKILKIQSQDRTKVVLKDENEERVTEKEFVISNYCSFGLESRIGIGFDRRRRNNPTCNKMIYFEEGFKKVFFQKSIPIDRLVETFETTNQDGNREVIFSASGDRTLLKKTTSLLALNIHSFGSGMDIWGSTEGKQRSGLLGVQKKEIRELAEQPQVVGDQKIEWVSFHSPYALGSEKICHGRARRVAQGTGPYYIRFKRTLTEKQRVYFEVDGEFFIALRPVEFQLRLLKQINVLSLNTEVQQDRFVST